MSAIAGHLRLDDAPSSPELLDDMLAVMLTPESGGSATWQAGPAGLGHIRWVTTDDAGRERQPCTLDGHVWLVADARIDGRRDLLLALAAAGRDVAADATDAELILHAYHAWDVRCPQRLLGDFAFAIWDAPGRRLLCARDHFGIKPFFYAHAGPTLVFASALEAARRCPGLTSDLDDVALVDYLVFGRYQDLDATAFKYVCRLPPAHILTVTDAGLRVERYWALPVDEPVRRRPDDQIEGFLEVFDQAVTDRMRTSKISVFMSGGMDSSAVAATATAAQRHSGKEAGIQAFLAVYDHLIVDHERAWSTLLARHLGIPVHHLPVDEYRQFDRWDRRRPAEPEGNVLVALDDDLRSLAAGHARVVLTGNGGDTILRPARGYLRREIGRLHWRAAAVDVGAYVRSHGSLPPLYVRSALRQRLRGTHGVPAISLPDWLAPRWRRDPELAHHLQAASAQPTVLHPDRPESYRDLTSGAWSTSLEQPWTPAAGPRLEARHPFFDLRVVRYALSVPPVPWCVNKELLRQAMAGRLPEQVLLRPKSPLSSTPDHAVAPHCDATWWRHLVAAPGLAAFVDPGALAALLRFDGTDIHCNGSAEHRAAGLAAWLSTSSEGGRISWLDLTYN